MARPEFDSIKSYEEFKKYTWARYDLSKICKEHGLRYHGTEEKLQKVIEAYFNGVKIPPERNWYSNIVLTSFVNDNGSTLIFDAIALLVSVVLVAIAVINRIHGSDDINYVPQLVFGSPLLVMALVWSYYGRDIDVIKSFFPQCGDKRFTRAQVDEQANSKDAVLLNYGDIFLAPDMLIGSSAGVVAVAYEDIASLQVKQTHHTERIGTRYSGRYAEYFTYKIIVRTKKGKRVAISRSRSDACYAVNTVYEHCLKHNPDVKLLDMKKSIMAPDESPKPVVSGKDVKTAVDKAVSGKFLTSITVSEATKRKFVRYHLNVSLMLIPVSILVAAVAAVILNLFLRHIHNHHVISSLITGLLFPGYAVYDLISTLITIKKDDTAFYSGEIAGEDKKGYLIKGIDSYRFGFIKSLRPDAEPKTGDRVIIARIKDDFSLISDKGPRINPLEE